MLWGGRFKEALDKDALKFSTSISFDKRLINEDIEGSIAHAGMLSSCNIITKDEANVLIDGLNKIKKIYLNGEWIIDESAFEDIHSAIETKLYEVAGVVAGKLHTGRSRNDQIATAMKLWVKKSLTQLIEAVGNLQNVMLNLALDNIDTIIPGYTHLQRAQPISFAFHLLAYVEMLDRDIERLKFCYNEANFSPLGSGALAGSTLPLDRELTSKTLGFNSPTKNALDTVSDRDYLLDYLNAVVVGMMHLSRLAEEIILWCSSEWSFVKLADSYTTGSSLMPQKKNPDMAELIRGKSGRVYGNYITLATIMKGLPLSYNRDLQEDKEPVFDSFETYLGCLNIACGMIATLTVNKDRFVEDLQNSFILSTDLADYLVLKGVPFREAHKIVGQIVKYAEDNNKGLSQLALDEMKSISSIIDESVFEYLDTNSSLQKKKTFGSPNKYFVKKEIESRLSL